MGADLEPVAGDVEFPLAARRDAAILSFALKLLDDAVVRPLRQFKPKVILVPESKIRSRPCGMLIQPTTSAGSLDVFKRSFFGRLPEIWCKLPMKMLYPPWPHPPGRRWRSIKKATSRYIISSFN